MGKVKSAKEPRRVVDTTPRTKTIQPRRLAFDAINTLIALRTLAKKRDPELRATTLKAYNEYLKRPPKAQPVPIAAPSLSFKSSLPIRVTEGAQKRIRQLKLDGATKVLFPPFMKGEAKVMYLDKNGKEQLLGVMRTGTVQVETDPMKMDISHVGLSVGVLESNKNLLEFIVKAPGLPAILRSRKLNDQGGLTHQLRISQLHGKKGG